MLRQDEDAVVGTQGGRPKRRPRFFEHQPHRVVVDDFGGVEKLGQIGQMAHGLGVVAQHVEGEGHVAGGEGLSIRPFDALAELYGDHGRAIVVLPVLGQPVFVLPGEHIEHDQRLKHRRQRTQMEGAGGIGVMVVEQGILARTAVHHDQGAVPGDIL